MALVKRRRSSVGSSLGAYAGGAVGAYMGGPVGRYVASSLGSYAGSAIGKALTGTKKRKTMVDSGIRNETSNSTRTALCKKKGNVNKGNRKKKVKVSKSLRKKIGKVIEEKKIHGTWTQKSYGYLTGEQGLQKVQYIQQTSPDYNVCWNFTPEDLLHIASVLFNGKTDSQNLRQLNNDANLGMQNGGEAAPFFAQNRGCFAKFHVQKSSMTYHLKNNSQSTVKVRAYTVAAKKAGVHTVGIDKPDGTQFTGQQMFLSPIDNWNLSLATQTGFNVTGASSQLVGIRPEQDPRFSQLYKYEVCDILLDPGQSTTFSYAGPCDQELDFSKFYQNQGFQNIQKFTRGTFFIVYHDITQGSGTEANFNNVGRYAAGFTGTGRVIIEKTMNVKLSIPESAGVKVEDIGAAGAKNIEMNFKRSVFGYKQYGSVAPGAVYRIDEEQPATII